MLEFLSGCENKSDGSTQTWTVYYQLTKDAAVPGWSDTDGAIGRWFRSNVHLKGGKIADYSYPYALQSDGSWMMCGRVVRDWSRVQLFSKIPD